MKAGDHLLLAAKKQAEGELEVHKANIKVYQTMPAGIGEHSDVTEAVIAELDKMSAAHDRIEMIEKYFSRDSFISEIYRKALTNKKIFFLSADFGAPSLDIFRKKLPNQFLHMCISEQNMIDVAIGLAIKKNVKKGYIFIIFSYI